MKIHYFLIKKILRKYNIKISKDNLLNKLIKHGLDVSIISKKTCIFDDNLIIAKIQNIDLHPNNKKYFICKVQYNTKHINIITKKNDIYINMIILLAKVNCKNPLIKKKNIYNIFSYGKICDYNDIFYNKNYDTIDLTRETKKTQLFSSFLKEKDDILHFNIPTNKGYLLNEISLLREILIIFNINIPLIKKEEKKVLNLHNINDFYKINFIINSYFKKYIGNYCSFVLHYNNILPLNHSNTPLKIKNILLDYEIEISNNIFVDLAKYIMHLTGQYINIIAIDNINNNNKLYINCSNKSNVFNVKGKKYIVKKNSLILYIDKKPISLCGAFVDDIFLPKKSSKIFYIEFITYNTNLYRTLENRKYLNYSSYRISRGSNTSKEILNYSINKYFLLINKYLNKKNINIYCSSNISLQKKKEKKIYIRKTYIDHNIGYKLSSDIIHNILKNIFLNVVKDIHGWTVHIPEYKTDISFPIHIVGEILRFYNINKFNSDNALYKKYDNSNIYFLSKKRIVSNILINNAYYENINFSLLSEKYVNIFYKNTKDLIKIKNPISLELSYLRQSLIPGLIQSYKKNYTRNDKDIKFFEIGRCFLKNNKQIVEKEYISGIISEINILNPWDNKNHNFFDLKNDIEKIFHNNISLYKNTDNIFFEQNFSFLILYNNKKIGYCGKIANIILQKLNIKCNVFAYEIDINNIDINKKNIFYKPINKYPKIIRDLTVIYKKIFIYQEIKNKILNITNYITNINIINTFNNNDENNITFRITFSCIDNKMLENKIVDTYIEKILILLKNDFNMHLKI